MAQILLSHGQPSLGCLFLLPNANRKPREEASASERAEDDTRDTLS